DGRRCPRGAPARTAGGSRRASAAVGDVWSVGCREVRNDEVTGGTVGAADQGQRRAERADETPCETKAETEVTGRPHAGAARDHVLGLDDELRPESGAAVADLDRGAAARRPRDDGYVALRGVPDGVVEERAQQAGELVAVGGEHEPGRHVDADRDRLLGGAAREVRAELAENVRETHG